MVACNGNHHDSVIVRNSSSNRFFRATPATEAEQQNSYYYDNAVTTTAVRSWPSRNRQKRTIPLSPQYVVQGPERLQKRRTERLLALAGVSSTSLLSSSSSTTTSTTLNTSSFRRRRRYVGFAGITIRTYNVVYGNDFDTAFPLSLGWEVLQENSYKSIDRYEMDRCKGMYERLFPKQITLAGRQARLVTFGYSKSQLVQSERRRLTNQALYWCQTERPKYAKRHAVPSDLIMDRLHECKPLF